MSKDPYLFNFGKSIASKRRETCLTQEEAAQMIGISLPALKRYESGTMNPSLMTALRICSTYKVDLNSMVYPNEKFPHFYTLRDSASWLATMFIDGDISVDDKGNIKIENKEFIELLVRLKLIRETKTSCLEEKIAGITDAVNKISKKSR